MLRLARGSMRRASCTSVEPPETMRAVRAELQRRSAERQKVNAAVVPEALVLTGRDEHVE